uniref:Hsp70 family protein n=1 Tax=Candidatus Electrothrix sp. TaxID=2170559 RepID=UPI004056B333
MNEIIIGIDLGTTNSEVAVVQDAHPVLLKNQNSVILPSYVGIDQDGALLVGEAARNQYAVYPERTIKSVKRLMGSGDQVEMAGKEYSPQEISAIILKSLKEIAEKQLKQKVEKAVITVPAYFSDVQRQATREAGEIAGLEVVKMINEPTAAALAYEGDAHVGKTIMVYDLGGGTFDVSVVGIEDGVIEVIASHGNNHLGGDDFDRKIVEHLLEHLKEEHGEISLAPDAEARISRAAEQAKITLSDNPFVTVKEEYLFEKDGVPVHLDLEISREEYEEMITPFIEESMEAVHIALKGANLTASDIEEVLLVGGSSRTPLVQQYFEKEIGLVPHCEIDPDLCVAAGAAVQAGMISGEEVSTVLVDITPYTFSTASLQVNMQSMSYDMVCVPLIKKNSPIPVKKSEVFYTVHDNQEKVQIEVYQGESTVPSENILIGEFMITGLSRKPEGNEIIDTFELDKNGILHVTAIEKCTGKSKKIEIDNAMAKLDKKEMDKARGKIGELFSSQSDYDIDGEYVVVDEENQEETKQGEDAKEAVEAEALIKKAEALMDDVETEDQEELVELVEAIRDALKVADGARLGESMHELNEVIFYLES